MTDFLKYYDLERHLFEDCGPRFRNTGVLSELDLFLILIWKANRAKTKTKNRLRRMAGSFSIAAERIGRGVHEASDSEEKLRILTCEWGFLLPTATAILTVLYPEEFTVYDVRVRDEIGLPKISESITGKSWPFCWQQYQQYKQAVIDRTPTNLDLRDKDRYLWARSFIKQAQEDLAK